MLSDYVNREWAIPDNNRLHDHNDSCIHNFNDTADSSKDKFMVKQKKWNGPAIYQVRMIGRLGSQWTNWFEGLSIKCQGKTTILTGRIVDQSALHGLLAKIRDLGMPIISVSRFETDIDHNME